MADETIPPLPEGFQIVQSPPPAAPVADSEDNSDSGAPPLPPGFQLESEKYGTASQQTLAGLEGLAQGVVSKPIATAAELASGLTTPEAIRAREQYNPWTHGIGEAAGFGASALTGVGEAPIVAGIGEVAAKSAGLGEASLLSRIATQGIKTGAEMAALQASDETAKMIRNDPGQSLGTAAVNVGLSGILGGLGGAAIGAVSPLWKASMEKIGAPKILDDAKAQYEFRQNLPNGGDVPGAITDELNTRLSEVDALRRQLGNIKTESISRALPDATEENISKIGEQAQSLAEETQKKIDALGDDPLARKLQDRLNIFKAQIAQGEPLGLPQGFTPAIPNFEQIPETVLTAPKPTPQRLAQISEAEQQAQAENIARANAAGYNPYDLSPKYTPASPQQVFDAMNSFKKQLHEWSEFSRIAPPPISDRPFISAAKDLGHTYKAALENPEVWGEAAQVQLRTNAAIKASIDAEKDALSKFTQKSATEGMRIADPTKVNTLVKQSLKGTAGLKSDFISQYVKATDNLADTINQVYSDAGLEAPVRLTPTPALSHTLGRSSPGTTLGNWLYDKGLASLAGNAAGASIGGGLGSVVGHPVFGAAIGEKLLAPALTSLAQPLLETATHGAGFKGALNYTISVMRGDKLVSDATAAVLRGAAEIIPKDLLPTAQSRKNLESSLESLNDPEQASNVGQNLTPMLPSHATAAATLAASAKTYFDSLEPKQPQPRPLDHPQPVSKYKQAVFDRQLDIAQQPLLALKYARNGTLQAQDVGTLKVLYPQLLAKFTHQLTNEIAEAKTNGVHIPYPRLQSLSLLMGVPLTSLATQPVMANIAMLNGPSGPPPAPQGKPRKVSQSTAKLQEKTNRLYATPSQARQEGRLNE